jgi:hypothetical protein
MVYMYEYLYKIRMDCSDFIQLYTNPCTRDDFYYQFYKCWNKMNNMNLVNLQKLGNGWAIDIKTNTLYLFLFEHYSPNVIIPKNVEIKKFVIVNITLNSLTRKESLSVKYPINCIINNIVKHFSIEKFEIKQELNNKRKRNETEDLCTKRIKKEETTLLEDKQVDNLKNRRKVKLRQSISNKEDKKKQQDFRQKEEEKKENKDVKEEIKQYQEDNLKQEKKLKYDWEEWIGASSTRNYFLDDPLIDWLKEFNVNDINQKPYKKEYSQDLFIYSKKNKSTKNFKDYILNEGVNFEEKVMIQMKAEKKYKIVQISDNYQSKNVELFQKTVDCMKSGVEIIYQGVLHDEENKLFGSPDILIRSDILNKFIGYNIYNYKEKSSKLGTDWHYVVIDIKNSIIHLKSDKQHVKNEGSVAAYKGQLYVYTKALNYIQGTNITKSFILGKKYTWAKHQEEKNPLKALGIIDFNVHDKWVIEKFENFKEWILEMRKNGLKWSIDPPSRKELYPNMKNEMETEYNMVKKQIAEKYHEITDVYYCNYEKRCMSHEKGIIGWNDKNCNSSSLGFNNGIISKRVDTILDINRSKDLIRPKKIDTGNNYWRNCFLSEKEYFLDFETINACVGNYDDFIFMIGVGCIDNNQWVYKNFIAKDLSNDSEKEILKQFLEYVDHDGLFYHWSNAEKSIYEKKLEKYNLNDIKFYDLNKFFVDNLIVVKGCLNWSLKNIAKKMFEYGFIKTNWNDDNCKDGLSAMILAFKMYKKKSKLQDFDPIIKYNEIDCKVMYEILNYLRINH